MVYRTDFTNTSEIIKLTITFSQPLLDVRFSLGDIDTGGSTSPPAQNFWQDVVVVTGMDGVNTVTPTGAVSNPAVVGMSTTSTYGGLAFYGQDGDVPVKTATAPNGLSNPMVMRRYSSAALSTRS